MKKLRTTMLTAALVCCTAFPAFADETDKAQRQEIRTEITAAKAEIKGINDQAKEIKAENKTMSQQLKELRKAKKAGSETGLTNEEWKEIRSLSKDLKSARTELKASKGEIKKLRTEAKASIKAKDLESGLEKLEKAADIREDRLESQKKINDTLKKITAIQ